MTKAPTFQTGDRIAFSAKFLRATRQLSGGNGAMRGTVTAVYPGNNESMGSIIEFITDAGTESGGLACNFIHDTPRNVCVDATRNS